MRKETIEGGRQTQQPTAIKFWQNLGQLGKHYNWNTNLKYFIMKKSGDELDTWWMRIAN